MSCTYELCLDDIIKWAFERGYKLACADIKDGVYIEYSETEKYFLKELEKYKGLKELKKYNAK